MQSLSKETNLSTRKDIQRRIRKELGLQQKGPIPRSILHDDDGTIADICKQLGWISADTTKENRKTPRRQR